MSELGQITGSYYPDGIDPVLGAIRQAVVDATAAGVDEFGEAQVMVVDPADTREAIDQRINVAMARTKGLALLLVPGDATNPDPSAPGPRLRVSLAAELYVSTRIRGRHARGATELLAALARLLHHAQIRVSGHPWQEELTVTGWRALQDDAYTAYELRLERDFQL